MRVCRERGNLMSDGKRGVWRSTMSVPMFLTCIALMLCLVPAVACAEFGVMAFDGQVSADPSGGAFTQAGGHPYEVSTSIRFNTFHHPVFGDDWPEEPVKDIIVDLPPGLVGNPGNAPKCTFEQLAGFVCPIASQIGSATSIANSPAPLNNHGVYNMVAPPGVPARFAMNLFGTLVVLDVSLRSDSDYGVTINARNLSEGVAVDETTVTFWGIPADTRHDDLRHCTQIVGNYLQRGCGSGEPLKPFITLPTRCTPDGVGLETTMRADSWFDPGDFKTASFVSHLPPGFSGSPGGFVLSPPLPANQWGAPVGTDGCDRVPFHPRFDAQPVQSARAGAPSGFTFDMTIPQDADNSPTTLAESDLKRAVVMLPEGVRVSPPSADGLAGCSSAQIALHSLADATCPAGSKIGTVEINTPLLPDPLTGSVYLASPHDNPSGTLLALYIVARGPGVIVKLPGRVDTDPVSGQLTATFDNTPQTPFSRLHLAFKDGPRAALVTPPRCGTYTTHAVLTGWSGKTVFSDSSFTIDRANDGGACKPLGFSPQLSAGTSNVVAGKDASFLLTLSRGDDDQELRSLSVSMPQGLLAHIAGVPLCAEAQAAAGTCGEGSRIGSISTAAGAGPAPFWLPGRVYLGGPYKGAPFNLVIVVPAVAGPFDLGTVVVRAPIYLDRKTATLRVASDPLPSVLQGITLQVRKVQVSVDRPHFIVNPTSCQAKQVRAAVGSTEGASANLSSRFQVGDCAALPLKPKMVLAVGGKGHTGLGARTPLTATLTQTKGQTGLKSVEVTLPLSLTSHLEVITDACTLAEFNTGKCEKARAGDAVAVTPLLDKPLRGGAYFVKNGNSLPDLMVALRGQVDFDLDGVITIVDNKLVRTTFDTVPDVPIKSFRLRLNGGRRGSIGNAENLCSARARRELAHVDFEAQNGKSRLVDQPLVIHGCGKQAKSSKRRGGRH